MKPTLLFSLTLLSLSAFHSTSVHAESKEPKGLIINCSTDVEKLPEDNNLPFHINLEAVAIFNLEHSENVLGNEVVFTKDGVELKKVTNHVFTEAMVNMEISPTTGERPIKDNSVMEGFYSVGDVVNSSSGERVEKVSSLSLEHRFDFQNFTQLELSPQLGDPFEGLITLVSFDSPNLDIPLVCTSDLIDRE